MEYRVIGRPRIDLIVAGAVLLAVLIGAFVIRENFGLGLGHTTERITAYVFLPGQYLDLLASRNVHAGFGDWRDYIAIIFGSWFVWMAPVVLIWLIRSKKNEETEA